MSNGKKILLVLIVLFGGLIAWFSYSYLSTSKTNIFLFNKNYEAGTAVTKDMFTVLEVDADMVTQLAYASDSNSKYVTADDLSQIISNGDCLGVDVYKGTPFMTTETSTIGGSAAERRLSDYKTAITIPVTNISGVSPEITAGARINIYASYATDSYQVEQLLFQNVKILDVQATGDADSGYTLSAFTIEVDPADAMQLLHAINYWKIDITLLKSGKYETMTTSSVYKVNTLMLDAIIAAAGDDTSAAVSTPSTTTATASDASGAASSAAAGTAQGTSDASGTSASDAASMVQGG